MSQEQQTLLCVIYDYNEFLQTKSNLTTSMLRLIFECHENNVNPSTVYDALSPFFLLVDRSAS